MRVKQVRSKKTKTNQKIEENFRVTRRNSANKI